MKIYTTSYYGHTPETLAALVQEHQAVLIDTRLERKSRRPGFAGASLHRVLPYDYWWVPNFGNINYKKRGAIELKDAQAGIEQVKIILETCNYRHSAIILLCACRWPMGCHRTVVGRLLSEATGLGTDGPSAIEELPEPPTMLALTLKQPWAWLVVEGYKGVENRSRRFKQIKDGSRLLIHAGLTFDRDGYVWVEDNFPEIEMPEPKAFQRGGIVGSATMVGQVSECGSAWFIGPNGLVLRDQKPMTFVPWRGQLYPFPVPVAVLPPGTKLMKLVDAPTGLGIRDRPSSP